MTKVRRLSRQKQQTLLRRVRRVAALLLSGAAVALLYNTDGGGFISSAVHAFLKSPAVVSTLLQTELGPISVGDGPLSQMNGWQSAVLSQSALLRAGESAVISLQAPTSSPDSSETASPSVSPTPEDSAEPTPSPSSDTTNIISQTFGPVSSTNYDQADGVYIFNKTKQTVNVAQLSATPPDWTLNETAPQVLIVHTHGSEAYHPEGNDIYEASDPYRTTDTNYNMIRVGDALTQVLEAKGIGVIHDKTMYDYPAYRGSYDRSLTAVQSYLQQYPTIQVVLDLHRDALAGSDGSIYKAVTTIDGEQVAQVMLVLGSDDGGLEHPNWQENTRFAIWLQKRLNEEYPTLARPMSLRTSRYNQQVSVGALLVEIGCHGNTLQEAIRGAKLFGNSLASLLLDLENLQSS